MTAAIHPHGRDRASFADDAEIAAFVETLGRFERGEIDAEAWRAYRVARGAYARARSPGSSKARSGARNRLTLSR